jgi:hypothetical protein
MVKKIMAELELELTRQAAITDLNGTTCLCTGAKKRSQTFCQTCYFSLPKATRGKLYGGIFAGYIPAMKEAIQYLIQIGRFTLAQAKERLEGIGEY